MMEENRNLSSIGQKDFSPTRHVRRGQKDDICGHMAPAMRTAAASHALAGRLTEARQIMERLRQLDPALRLSNLADLLPPFRLREDHARFMDGLRKAGL